MVGVLPSNSEIVFECQTYTEPYVRVFSMIGLNTARILDEHGSCCRDTHDTAVRSESRYVPCVLPA